MNELREDILSSVLLSTQTKTIVCAFIDNHLEKERQQIKDAYFAGEGDAYNQDEKWAEDYYNETYKK